MTIIPTAYLRIDREETFYKSEPLHPVNGSKIRREREKFRKPDNVSFKCLFEEKKKWIYYMVVLRGHAFENVVGVRL